jgi:hypothetical protein
VRTVTVDATQTHPSSGRVAPVSKCGSGQRRVDVIEFAEFAEVYRKRLEFFVTAVQARTR